MPPLTSLQLRRLFLGNRTPSISIYGRLSRAFSSSLEGDTAVSLSRELLKDPESEPLSIADRLRIGFSHVSPTPSLVESTLKLCSEAGRTVLVFNDWLVSTPGFSHSDETVSLIVDFLGKRKDFKAIDKILTGHRNVIGDKTLSTIVYRLVRAGRETKTVSFFDTMERKYGFKRNRDSLKLVIKKLCNYGFASHAERMVKSLSDEFFPDEETCDILIRGWCVDGKIDEARRLAGEIYRGGFELGTPSYNAMLNCVCKLCRLKNPYRLDTEAEIVLLEMDRQGVPRNDQTFEIMIRHLCKLRRTEDAMSLFRRMNEWNCVPNAKIHLDLIKSLYRAARVGEGDEMIDLALSSGHREALSNKMYLKFIKILCNIRRFDHALTVLERMKSESEPNLETYEVLMRKLAAVGLEKKANALFREARLSGIEVVERCYPLDWVYVKQMRLAREAKEAIKNKKKRLTLPEKTRLKKKKLFRLRNSYVVKSRRTNRLR